MWHLDKGVKMFEKILVAIDGSKQSYKAVTLAAQMAQKYDAKLYILSVFQHNSLAEGSLPIAVSAERAKDLDKVLSEYAKEVVQKGKDIALDNGLQNCVGYVKMGNIAKEILNFTTKEQIDLIVVGSQGDSNISNYLLGSVPQKVTTLAKCPVLVV